MNTKRLLIIAMTALLVLSITSCVMKKSTPPPQPTFSESEESLFPEPETGTNSLDMLSPLATQTALGAAGHTLDQTPSDISLTPNGSETPETQAAPTLQPLATNTPDLQTPVVMNVPAATSGPPPATYTLQKGEFPYCIARRFNVNVGTLLSLNGLNLNSKPAAGVTLKIPQDGVPFGAARALHTHPATYTITTNDSIYSVACYYGDVDPMVIAQTNNLQAPYTLTAGQTLSIP